MSAVCPPDVPIESTTTVVIGAGLPGLAVASELSRHGVASIVLEGMGTAGKRRSVMTDSVSLTERSELLRLLRGYATSHRLDVRPSTMASKLSRDPQQKWVIHTEQGILQAESVVLTDCPQNQVRRFLRGLGLSLGKDLRTSLKSLGLYLVGVADLLTPSTREIVRQAKLVGDAIAGGRMLTA